MTRIDCLAADQVEQALALAPEHPVSRHVRECPRCSALVLEYRDFLAATHEPAGADTTDASRRLSGAIADLVSGVPATRSVVAAPSPSLAQRLAQWWSGPARGPALAVAGLAIVAAGWFATRGPAPGGDTLRGPGDAARPMLELRAMVAGSDALVLGWASVAGADLYAVTLLDATLEPRAELPLTADTAISLARAQWPAVAPGETLYVRIDALHETQVIGISSLHPLVLPR